MCAFQYLLKAYGFVRYVYNITYFFEFVKQNTSQLLTLNNKNSRIKAAVLKYRQAFADILSEFAMTF